MEEINKKLDAILERLEDTPTNQDLMAITETLQNITDETAVSLEHKQESGDVLLKSLIDGLEDRMIERFDKVEKQLEEHSHIMLTMQNNINNLTNLMYEHMKQTDKRFDQIDRRFDQVLDVMRSWVTKQTDIETQIQELKRRIEGDSDNQWRV